MYNSQAYVILCEENLHKTRHKFCKNVILDDNYLKPDGRAVFQAVPDKYNGFGISVIGIYAAKRISLVV